MVTVVALTVDDGPPPAPDTDPEVPEGVAPDPLVLDGLTLEPVEGSPPLEAVDDPDPAAAAPDDAPADGAPPPAPPVVRS